MKRIVLLLICFCLFLTSCSKKRDERESSGDRNNNEAVECTHDSYNSDFTCSSCGKPCTNHKYNENAVCKYCSKPYSVEYKDDNDYISRAIRVAFPKAIEMNSFEENILRPMMDTLEVKCDELFGEDVISNYFESEFYDKEEIEKSYDIHRTSMQDYKNYIDVVVKDAKNGLYEGIDLYGNQEHKTKLLEISSIAKSAVTICHSYAPINLDSEYADMMETLYKDILPKVPIANEGYKVYYSTVDRLSPLAAKAELFSPYCPDYTIQKIYEDEIRCGYKIRDDEVEYQKTALSLELPFALTKDKFEEMILVPLIDSLITEINKEMNGDYCVGYFESEFYNPELIASSGTMHFDSIMAYCTYIEDKIQDITADHYKLELIKSICDIYIPMNPGATDGNNPTEQEVASCKATALKDGVALYVMNIDDIDMLAASILKLQCCDLIECVKAEVACGFDRTSITFR